MESKYLILKLAEEAGKMTFKPRSDELQFRRDFQVENEVE